MWPTYTLHDELSAHEEEIAFANYQQGRFAFLRSERAKRQLDVEEVKLFEALRQRIANPLGAGEKALRESAVGRSALQKARNLQMPCRSEWERMTMSERLKWIPDEQRTLPEPGDVRGALSAAKSAPFERAFTCVDLSLAAGAGRCQRHACP